LQRIPLSAVIPEISATAVTYTIDSAPLLDANRYYVALSLPIANQTLIIAAKLAITFTQADGSNVALDESGALAGWIVMVCVALAANLYYGYLLRKALVANNRKYVSRSHGERGTT
jgi:hypothetical protein